MNAGSTNKFRDNTCEYGCSQVWVGLSVVAGLLCFFVAIVGITSNPVGSLTSGVIGLLFFAFANLMYKRTQ